MATMGTSEEVRSQGPEGSGRKHSGRGGQGQMVKDPRNWGFILMVVGTHGRELCRGMKRQL